MVQAATPLIVGAGPVGLGAALLLQQAGVRTRIVDKAEQRSTHSKALAVNPRTLELLEPTGVIQRMLKIGLRIDRVRFRFANGEAGELSMHSLKHKYPFMLALSQATTERLLEEALEAAGGKVERGTALMACQTSQDGVEAKLEKRSTHGHETVRCPWLLAADGAHSSARESLNIRFEGSSFSKPWYLADVPLETSLENNFGHVFFLPNGGFLFLIRVVDETTEQSPGPKLWRVISNFPNPVGQIEQAKPAGAPVWASEFHISHRLNQHLQVGNIYFAGDAAHIHSPIGARGMNLGLEDAWVFSRLTQLGRVREYESMRMKCDRAVVKRVESLSRIVISQSMLARAMRKLLLRWLIHVPFIQSTFLKTTTGLDHPLELEPNAQGSQLTREKLHVAAGKTTHQHAH